MSALNPAIVMWPFVNFSNYETRSPYEFDLDVNGALALTEDNVARTRFLLQNDSSYRAKSSEETPQTVEDFCEAYPHFWDTGSADGKSPEDLTEQLVEIIDRMNSTHQASEGSGGGNNGRLITAKRICEIKDLGDRLKRSDPALVDEIAKSIPNRYTFSFATKFCTYVSLALFPEEAKSNGYSKYDLIIRQVLPYYAVVYLGDDIHIHAGKSVKDPYAKFGIREHIEDSD